MAINKTKLYRISCLIVGIMILVLPIATYSIIKYQTESSGQGIVVGENDAYMSMIGIGIIGIASGILLTYLGNDRSAAFYLACLIVILIALIVISPKPHLGT